MKNFIIPIIIIGILLKVFMPETFDLVISHVWTFISALFSSVWDAITSHSATPK